MDLDQLSRVDNGGVLELDRLELVVGELVVNDFGVISAKGKVGVGHQLDVDQLSRVDSGRVLELDSLELVVRKLMVSDFGVITAIGVVVMGHQVWVSVSTEGLTTWTNNVMITFNSLGQTTPFRRESWTVQ